MAFADALSLTALVLGLGAILVWALPDLPPETSHLRSTRKPLLQ
jgi:hypothetical protein